MEVYVIKNPTAKTVGVSEDYINTAKKYNCEIIKMARKRKILSLPVFTSREDAENMKKESDCKLLLFELKG